MNNKWPQKKGNIRSAEMLDNIHTVPDRGDPVLVRWFYFGASAPGHKAFDSCDDFIACLDVKARRAMPWISGTFTSSRKCTTRTACCPPGKQRNESGATPEGGAY